MRFWSLGMVVIASALVAACTYDDGPDPTKHFLKLEMDAPQGNEVVVCHCFEMRPLWVISGHRD
jgi:hypothetical protein